MNISSSHGITNDNTAVIRQEKLNDYRTD